MAEHTFSRVQRGVTEGGQFTASARTEPNVSLASSPQRDGNLELFAERAEQYRQFVEDNGKEPQQKASEAHERLLGDWIGRQRWIAGKGRLPQAKRDILDQAHPDWSVRGRPLAGFVEKAAQYDAFRAEHGRNPSPYCADEQEADLGRWLERQQGKKLRADRAAILNAVNPDWRRPPSRRPRVASPRVREYQGFRHERGNDPSQVGGTYGERSLAWYLGNQRQRLPPPQGEHLDRVNEAWLHQNGADPEQVFVDQVDQYRQFRNLHGRDPKRRASDPDEHRLGTWLEGQRTRVATPERAAMLSKVSTGWRGSSAGRPVAFGPGSGAPSVVGGAARTSAQA